MKGELKSWQRSMVRKNVAEYRQALENYYIKDKTIIEMEGGYKAFSLLSPPVSSPAARRRLHYIIDNLLEKDPVGLANSVIPLKSRTAHFVTIAVSYNCQCDCSHCSASLYQSQTKLNNDTLTLPELKQAVADFVALGSTSIVLTGGEPFLFEGLFELIESVDKSKAICTIFTNGEYLDAKVVKQLKRSGAFGVFVSFDFADPLKHETNRRRPGIFQKAVQGIKLCQEAGILTGISTFVTREKIKSGEMDALMELGKELKVIEVFIFDVIPMGKLQDNGNCRLSKSDFDWIKGFRAEYNQKKEYPRIIHQTMLTSIAFPCTGEGCPAGVAHMHLRANGDVSPCDFTPYSFGNIRNQSLKDIWRGITSSAMYAHPSPHCRLADSGFLNSLESSGRTT
jgi:MoaA/NifB/PqqE/SkfB family radical SAM enzyme